jgi:hypothetical protein
MYMKGRLEKLSPIWRMAAYITYLGYITADHVNLSCRLYRAQ